MRALSVILCLLLATSGLYAQSVGVPIGGNLERAISLNGGTIPQHLKVVGGLRGSTIVPIALDSANRLLTDASVTEVATAAEGAALPALAKYVAGKRGTSLVPFELDAANQLKVAASFNESATAADGSAAPAVSKVVAGVDGVGNTQSLSTDTNGRANVNVVDALPAGTNNIGDVDVLTEPGTAADGGALPATTKVVSGYDGANVQAISVDSSGNVQTELASAIPAGTNNIGDVDVLTQPARDDGTDSIRLGDGTDLTDVTASGELEVSDATTHTSLSSIDGKLNSLGQKTMANSMPVVIASDQSSVDVDVVSALPAGTNNIGDVDVASEQATVANGGAIPSVLKVVAGYDGANVRAIKVSTDGTVQTSASGGGSANGGSTIVVLEGSSFIDSVVTLTAGVATKAVNSSTTRRVAYITNETGNGIWAGNYTVTGSSVLRGRYYPDGAVLDWRNGDSLWFYSPNGGQLHTEEHFN